MSRMKASLRRNSSKLMGILIAVHAGEMEDVSTTRISEFEINYSEAEKSRSRR